jgi:hypothetical protein
VQTTEKGTLIEVTPRNVKDVYWWPQESGSNTMLNILFNILWRVGEGEREKKEQKRIMDYIVLSLI